MPVTDYNTWNPQLHFEMVGGGLSTEELVGRTLGLTLTDRDRNFDHIEWELDNSDGLLTRPEYIATGLMVRLKLGYIDGPMPWRAFVINRMRGGVGVWGRDNPAVGDNERKITFLGRNRNAPGGSRSRGKRGRARAPSKRTRKVYGPTLDVTEHELLLEQKDLPRRIPCQTTSEGVEKIAERNGFVGSFYARIEPTADAIEQLTIPDGMSDGTYLSMLARKHHFVSKIDAGIFRWHSQTWEGAKYRVVESYQYGMGPDIITLDIDADFRLPTPARVKASGYDYRLRRGMIADLDHSKLAAKSGVTVATFYNDFRGLDDRERVLTRSEVMPIISATQLSADSKAVARFVRRHLNAFVINLTVVGNPRLVAGHLLELGGTGSPFVDGTWTIKEARHIFNGSTYVSSAKLKQTAKPSTGKGRGRLNRGMVQGKNGKVGYNYNDMSGLTWNMLATKPPVSGTR